MKKLIAIALGVALAGVGTVALAGRSSSGSYSLPSGNPVVSGTRITSSWANSTLADMGQGITDSLDRSGRGGMLSPLKGVDGTVSAPAFTFTSETNSGIYRGAPGSVRISALGTLSLRCDAAGVTIPGTLSVSGTATLSGDLALTGIMSAASGITGLPAPSANGDAVRKSYADALGVTTATANSIMRRDASGGTQVSSPVADNDAANKAYVDGVAPRAVVFLSSSGTASLLEGSLSGLTFSRVSVGQYRMVAATYRLNASVMVMSQSGSSVTVSNAGGTWDFSLADTLDHALLVIFYG